MNVEEARKRVIEMLGEGYLLTKVEFKRFAVGRNETYDKVAVLIEHKSTSVYGEYGFDFIYEGEGVSLEDALAAAFGNLT